MGEIADDIIDQGLLDEDNEEMFDPEEYWEDGRHRTSDGDVVKIKDMTEAHLEYAIRYFKRTHDTSVLQKELSSRSKRK